MDIQTKDFSELSAEEVYEILRLRAEVFVVEQECAYLDPDEKDSLALHVLGWEDDLLVAYTRVFPAGDYMDECSIGRVAVRAPYRGKGLGFAIMEASINTVMERFGRIPIALSAQVYLRNFYEEMGFKAKGAEYLEDGIPHIRMVREAPEGAT